MEDRTRSRGWFGGHQLEQDLLWDKKREVRTSISPIVENQIPAMVKAVLLTGSVEQRCNLRQGTTEAT